MAARSVSESVYGMSASRSHAAATGGCERDGHSTPWGLALTHERLCARAVCSSQLRILSFFLSFNIYFARGIQFEVHKEMCFDFIL